ncbi:MAG TPA: ATP-binding cassette domain-containing protein [Thermomicrobiales bacterium]|jgi:ABC-2 type transport system ATP-binding protein|nr:ATP-binding cassette domain-containing protein [Thermomicrobiales bacterium]
MSLDVSNITKTFNNFTAVSDISFTVQPGRIFGFLGTNGAGKTTTMRMILDIIRPDTGTITWNGTPTRDLPREMFGYLPEERGLYPKMEVEDQLQFIGQLYGASASDIDARITEWLERLNITENRKKTVEQLSKGNQQKIQFLASLLHDPEILILDEPFSGLDPVNAEQMKNAFREMRDRGKTIIFSTHQLDDAQELSSDVAIIHRGRLMTSGSVEEVRQSVGEHYVRVAIAGDPQVAWLDEIPELHVVRRRQDFVEVAVPDAAFARERVLGEAIRRELPVTKFEIDYPSLNDVFLTLVQQMPAEMQPTEEELAAPATA